VFVERDECRGFGAWLVAGCWTQSIDHAQRTLDSIPFGLVWVAWRSPSSSSPELPAGPVGPCKGLEAGCWSFTSLFGSSKMAVVVYLESRNEECETEEQQLGDSNGDPQIGDRIKFSKRVLDHGFYSALVLAAASFSFASIYLYRYLGITSTSVDQLVGDKLSDQTFYLAVLARLAVAKYCLSACGACIGLSFGFLGFGLFLVGARDPMDTTGSDGKYQLHLSQIAPGTFVLLCATTLIAICLSRNISVSFAAGTNVNQNPQATVSPGDQYKLPDPGRQRTP